MGYRPSSRPHTHVAHPLLACCLQIDGGLTFTEPTAIISGKVEGQENVSVAPSRDKAVALQLGAVCAPSDCLCCLAFRRCQCVSTTLASRQVRVEIK